MAGVSLEAASIALVAVSPVTGAEGGGSKFSALIAAAPCLIRAYWLGNLFKASSKIAFFSLAGLPMADCKRVSSSLF